MEDIKNFPVPQGEYKVLIKCFTFNHERYIEDALKGFVMQKTNFPFVAVVVDDASTDGTADIIRKYEAEYPHIIKGFYLKENHHSQKKKKAPYIQPWRDCAVYEALCEGDDYWEDPYKLQKQVDYMDSHPDASLCFHPHYLLYGDGRKELVEKYDTDVENCGIERMMISGGGFMATNSMMYRLDKIQDYPEWAKKSPVGDFPLMLILYHRGVVGYLKNCTSVYRVQAQGSWSSRMKSFSFMKRHFKGSDRMLSGFNEWSGGKYRNIVLKKRIKNRLVFYKLICKKILKRS